VPLLQQVEGRPQRRSQRLARATERNGDLRSERAGERVDDDAEFIVADLQQPRGGGFGEVAWRLLPLLRGWVVCL
tara:strand:+ start:851 stop:1075 length:225 start_codon:yes stop_codon:yes gene_type:complete